jgi:hypothetical protein
MAFVVLSKGKGFTSWLIRWFTTQIIRKDVLVAAGVSLVVSWWYLFWSLFGLTAYAKIVARINHVFIVYYSTDFRQTFAIDIREHGPIPVAVQRALKQCKFIRVYEPTYDLFTGVRANVRQIATGYDWLMLIGSVFLILWYLLTGIRAKRTPHSPSRNVCSEYVVGVINSSVGAQNIGIPTMFYPQSLDDLLSTSQQYNLVYEGKPVGFPYMKP